MKRSTFRPRGLLNKEVAGICGVARLADKARAAHAGEIGNYKYGTNSKQDMGILSFLGISAETFQQTAVQIQNDVRLGAWVLDNCGKSDKDISMFNRKLRSWWKNKIPQDSFSKRRRELGQQEENRMRYWLYPWFWR